MIHKNPADVKNKIRKDKTMSTPVTGPNCTQLEQTAQHLCQYKYEAKRDSKSNDLSPSGEIYAKNNIIMILN